MPERVDDNVACLVLSLNGNVSGKVIGYERPEVDWAKTGLICAVLDWLGLRSVDGRLAA